MTVLVHSGAPGVLCPSFTTSPRRAVRLGLLCSLRQPCRSAECCAFAWCIMGGTDCTCAWSGSQEQPHLAHVLCRA